MNQKNKKEQIEICPHCGGKDIEYKSLESDSKTPAAKCMICNKPIHPVIINKIDLKKIQIEINKKSEDIIPEDIFAEEQQQMKRVVIFVSGGLILITIILVILNEIFHWF